MIIDSEQKQDSVSGLDERLRGSAFWVGVLGIVINAVAYAALYALDDVTPLLTLEVTSYALILGVITICSYKDFYVRPVLYGGMIAIYSVFWTTAFAYAWRGDTLLLSLPLALFVPLMVTMVLPHKMLFAIAPVQFGAVFLFVGIYALPQLGPDLAAPEQFAFSFALAAFSAVTMLAFAVLALTRANADAKLLRLVGEKERIASLDSLTGLFNRRAFLAQLEAQWPPVKPLAIAFVDLDHFKPLNDQYGHTMGDFVLRQVAQRLRDAAGAIVVARFGGDEFAVCCSSSSNLDSAEASAAALHNRICDEFQTEFGPISMGASVGYAVLEGDMDSPATLMRAADAAMRRAKATRSGWALFNKRIDSDALSSTSIEFELKTAVRRGHIRAAVQPIARMSDLKVIEYELLARWVDSGFEQDPGPAQFIPIAEKLGLLNEILWVTLDEALGKLDVSDLKLALNVSPAQLLASDFLETLMSILARHNVEPRSITLEITEEVVFRNLDRNVSILERARNAGMSIALDDFGSGYSSLSMLDALPLDKLKIDQGLIKKAQYNARSANILTAAINLAKQLDLIACVEGVETEEALSEITRMGADQVQGYWIGKPRLLQSHTSPNLQLVPAKASGGP